MAEMANRLRRRRQQVWPKTRKVRLRESPRIGPASNPAKKVPVPIAESQARSISAFSK